MEESRHLRLLQWTFFPLFLSFLNCNCGSWSLVIVPVFQVVPTGFYINWLDWFTYSTLSVSDVGSADSSFLLNGLLSVSGVMRFDKIHSF